MIEKVIIGTARVLADGFVYMLMALMMCEILNEHLLWRYGVDTQLSMLQVWIPLYLFVGLIELGVCSMMFRFGRAGDVMTGIAPSVATWFVALIGTATTWGLVAVMA